MLSRREALIALGAFAFARTLRGAPQGAELPLRTPGLEHIGLTVPDPEATAKFYGRIFNPQLFREREAPPRFYVTVGTAYLAFGGMVNAMPRVDHICALVEDYRAQEMRKVLDMAIEHTEVLRRRFRHCAARAMMILRSYKGHEKRVGRQQVSSMILMNAVKRIDSNFCILKEARREVLEDLMDIESTQKVIEGIEQKKILVKEIHNKLPSPFAFNLVLQGFSDIMKIEDRLEFMRRMHEQVMAKIKVEK